MKPGWNARGERVWRQLARWLLLGASILGTHVAMGGTTGSLELGLFAGCILLNEARVRTRLDRSGPLMTLFWVFLFVAIPTIYLVYRAQSVDPATDPLSISSGLKIPVEPIIISLALPFQVFAAYVPGIPRAQHLVLAFVLVEAILGARSRAWTPDWMLILGLLLLVGLCLVVGHVASVTVAVRARGSGEVRRRVSAGNLLRLGTMGLLVRALVVALIAGAVLFVMAPRNMPQADTERIQPITSLPLPRNDSSPSFPDSNLPPPEVNFDAPVSVAQLSNGVSLGDFGRILRDHTPVAVVNFSRFEGAGAEPLKLTRPLLKATSLSRFDGTTWAAPGRTRVGPNSGWEPYPVGEMLDDWNLPDRAEDLRFQLRLAAPVEAAPMQLFLPARPLGITHVSTEQDGSPMPRGEYHAGHDEYRVWGWYDGARITGYEAVIRAQTTELGQLENPFARVRVHPDLTSIPTNFREILQQEWHDQVSFRSLARNPLVLAQRLESWFKHPGRFRYSLEYRPVGDDAIMRFICLPKERQGHCEYFASAMAVILRYFGVPARVCVGYAPTNVAADGPDNSFLVLRSDAHAWVEAFSPTHGWVPFDPTPPAALGEDGAHPTLTPGAQMPPAEAEVPAFDPVTEFSPAKRSELIEAVGAAMMWIGSVCTTLIELPWRLLPLHLRPPSGPIMWLLTFGLLAIAVAFAFPAVRKRLRRRALVSAGMGSRRVRSRRARSEAADEVIAERARSHWRELLTILADHGYFRAAHQTPSEFAETVARVGGDRFAPVTVAAEAYGHLRYGDPRFEDDERGHQSLRDVEARFQGALVKLRAVPKKST